MSSEGTDQNTDVQPSHQAPVEQQALNGVIEIVKHAKAKAAQMGLRGVFYDDLLTQCNQVLAGDLVDDRIKSALSVAALLQSGNDQAKANASKLVEGVRKMWPDVPDPRAYVEYTEVPSTVAEVCHEEPEAVIESRLDDADPELEPHDVREGSPQGETMNVRVHQVSGRVVSVKTADLATAEALSSLFPVDMKMVSALSEDMKQRGFDEAHPVIVWAERGVIVDGHTRLAAAELAGLKEIFAVLRTFSGDDDAIAFAVREQRDRRNLQDGDYLKLVEALDNIRKRGGDRRSAAACSITSHEVFASSSETAVLLGISATRVENARAVLAFGGQALRDAVAAGKKSLHKAAAEVRAASRQKKAADAGKSAKRAVAALDRVVTELSAHGSLFAGMCERIAALAGEIKATAAKANDLETSSAPPVSAAHRQALQVLERKRQLYEKLHN